MVCQQGLHLSAVGRSLPQPEKTPAQARMEGASKKEYVGVGLTVSQLSGVLALYWFLLVSMLSRLGAGEGKWCPPVLLFLEKSPKDPCPSSTCSEVGK